MGIKPANPSYSTGANNNSCTMHVDFMAGALCAGYSNYMIKHVALLVVLGLSTGCASVGGFMAKSHYVGNKVPVYNAATGRMQYVYAPYAMQNQAPQPPAPAARP